MIEKNHVLEILKQAVIAIKGENIILLRELSNKTINSASIYQDADSIALAVNIYASENVILQRLGGRRICKKCGAIFHLVNKIPKKEGICDLCGCELYQRPDEMPNVIKDRLKVYREKTRPLEDYYRKKGILREIKANADLNSPNFKEEVLDKIESTLDSVKDK